MARDWRARWHGHWLCGCLLKEHWKQADDEFVTSGITTYNLLRAAIRGMRKLPCVPKYQDPSQRRGHTIRSPLPWVKGPGLSSATRRRGPHPLTKLSPSLAR